MNYLMQVFDSYYLVGVMGLIVISITVLEAKRGRNLANEARQEADRQDQVENHIR
jgi:hypothetical protein